MWLQDEADALQLADAWNLWHNCVAISRVFMVEEPATLREGIDEGDMSGVAEDSSLEGILRDIRARRAVRGSSARGNAGRRNEGEGTP